MVENAYIVVLLAGKPRLLRHHTASIWNSLLRCYAGS